jgi:hypothetical protein
VTAFSGIVPIFVKQRHHWIELQVDPFEQSGHEHGGRERSLKFDQWRVVAAARTTGNLRERGRLTT